MGKSRGKPNAPAPRGRKGAERRAAILEAAEQIFAAGGLAGARTDAIALRAHVNKALLYYYFRGKDALFHAVLEDHLKEFHRRGLEVLSQPGPAPETLMRYVTMHFDFISARPYYPNLFQRLMLTGGRPLERLAKEHIEPLSRKLAGLIERGMRQGEFRRVESVHTVISLAALTVFYFSSAPIVRLVGHIDPYNPRQLEQRKKEVLDFIRYALFRKPEARRS
jgi:TetR/AcrR family transcriptional regulator